MIELNLTYEESKKILELGYDFSPVCDRFIEELTRLKKPEYVEKEHFHIEVFRSEADQHIKDCWIPLIPKAALEACLPTGLSFGLTAYGYLRYDYDVGEFQYYENPDYYYDDGTIHYGSKFEYEIFTWLHKNYPEELKKKFDEVMG
jgi:hypothetical protein